MHHLLANRGRKRFCSCRFLGIRRIVDEHAHFWRLKLRQGRLVVGAHDGQVSEKELDPLSVNLQRESEQLSRVKRRLIFIPACDCEVHDGRTITGSV